MGQHRRQIVTAVEANRRREACLADRSRATTVRICRRSGSSGNLTRDGLSASGGGESVSRASSRRLKSPGLSPRRCRWNPAPVTAASRQAASQCSENSPRQARSAARQCPSSPLGAVGGLSPSLGQKVRVRDSSPKEAARSAYLPGRRREWSLASSSSRRRFVISSDKGAANE